MAFGPLFQIEAEAYKPILFPEKRKNASPLIIVQLLQK
jgi:hypothetical protein